MGAFLLLSLRFPPWNSALNLAGNLLAVLQSGDKPLPASAQDVGMNQKDAY
jgi:hypothetical protein